MQSLKFLTIRGKSTFLASFTFPNLIFLEISTETASEDKQHLSGDDIPHCVETLNINNVEVDLNNISTINPLRNIRVFEAVDSILVFETHDMFSLPKIQSLSIKHMRIHGKDLHAYPNISLIFNAHESIESVHSLNILRMHATTAAINTLRMMKGLTKLTIGQTSFEGDVFDSFRQMLMPYERKTAFPSLQFLRLHDIGVYNYKGERFTKMNGDRMFTDIN
jgi:hypothetical protein